MAQGWQTGLELHQAEPFDASGQLRGEVREDAERKIAVIGMRRVGWLDQRGRVWLSCPPAREFDGGSLTPLLIQVGD